ncbi:MAG: DUF3488 domain-containing protein [Candidatus Riflebacteria bacterium]|nr:DUF3488 domain-containing protein [Candidatus Riflebacteria bacterium]
MSTPVAEPALPGVALTTTGYWCLFLGIFLLVAAGNTGNNFLYLISSGLISLLIVSSIVAVLNLRRLRLSWDTVPDCCTGSTLEAGIRIENLGTHPSGLLRLEDEYLGGLNPGEAFVLKIRRMPEKRGRFDLGDITLSSLFPLGLVNVRRVLGSTDAWAYPAPRPFRLEGGEEGSPYARFLRPDAAGDYYMHRTYEPGEDARHIDWQASARGDQEWITLRALPFSEPVRFWIDTFTRHQETGEAFLGRVAGLLITLHRGGSQALLWFPESGGVWLPLLDRGSLTRCLRRLASCDLSIPALPPVEQGAARAMRLAPETLPEGSALDAAIRWSGDVKGRNSDQTDWSARQGPASQQLPRTTPAFEKHPLYASIIGTGLMSIVAYWTTEYPHPAVILTFLFIGIYMMIRGSAPASGALISRMGSSLVFGLALYRATYNIPMIIVLADFTMGILVIQWFLIGSHRSARQSIILAGMLMLATAAMNANFFLPLAFLPFLILFLSALGHLTTGESRYEMRRCFHGVSAVSIRFATVIALLFLSLGVAIFYLIPRRESLGVGSLADQRRLLGFSDRLQLGEFGPLFDNPQIVMRVKPVLSNPPDDDLMDTLSNITLRGCSFIEYKSGGWSRKGYAQYLVNVARYRGELVISNDEARSATESVDPELPKIPYRSELELELFLENTDPPVLFVPEGTRKIKTDLPYLAVDTDGAISFTRRRTGVETYRANIALGSQKGILGKADGSVERVPDAFKPFIDPGDLSASVRDLAVSLASGTQSWDEKIRVVVSYLGRTCRYGVDLVPTGIRDPVAFFLFQSHQGTCEHFATTMVLLLRSMGIPARPVNGYAMGEWNAFGGYFNVRQSDAHSWVEVYRPGHGWITYDPTPPVHGNAFSLLDRFQLRDLWNRFEGVWFTYVYSYDSLKQKDGFQKLRHRLAGIATIHGGLTALGLLLPFVFLLRLVTRMKKHSESGDTIIVGAPWLPAWYRDWSAHFPQPRRDWETPREFHSRLLASADLPADSRPILADIEDALDRCTLGESDETIENARSLCDKILIQ